MKIAIAIENFDPDGGGAERSTLQIARELTRRGHAVHLIAGYAPRALSPSSAGDRGPAAEPVIHALSHRHSSRVTRLFRFARFAHHHLSTGGYDITLSVTSVVPAMFMQPRGGTVRETLERNIAMRSAPMARLKKRVSLWFSPKHQALLALERRALRSPLVRRFLALSDYVARQLTQGYAIDPTRITVIPNASAAPTFSAEERLVIRTQIRRAFAIPDNAYVLVFAALNPRLKGLDTLYRALAMLKKETLDIRLLAAGDIDYPWQERAADLGVRDRVIIINRTARMAELYLAADVTVLPTHYDPSSKVVIESLMLAVPAITTACNGAGDFIHSERCGRVIADPSDVPALAAAIRDLSDPTVRAACAAAARDANLADRLSMTRHVDELERVFAGDAASNANAVARIHAQSPSV